MPKLPDEKPGMHRWAHAKLFRFAQQNRRPLTPAEQALWEVLSNKKLDGWKFRRQHPCGSYILDFYCHQARLCVEVDGGYHHEPDQQEADVIRTAYLEEAGIRVLRFANSEVMGDLNGVVGEIRRALGAPAP